MDLLQDLEGDERLALLIDGAEYLGHRPSADQLVDPETLTDDGAEPVGIGAGHPATITLRSAIWVA